MGTVYSRRGKLFIGFKDVDGKRKYRPTDFLAGEETKAKKLLVAVEQQVKAPACPRPGARPAGEVRLQT